MSNAERKNKIPEAPTPAPVPGNLLSNVAPPSQLPNFAIPKSPIPPQMLPPGLSVSPQSVPMSAQSVPMVPQSVPMVPQSVPMVPQSVPMPQPTTEHQSQIPQSSSMENFSPAIPFSKGEPTLPIRSPDPEDSETTPTPGSLSTSPEVDNIGDVMPGSGLLSWVKGAVSSGLLQRVAERAKSSVDSMITTLDPQMKDYLKSGGDVYIVVASDKDVKVGPIREAFQAVFGKATVVGMAAQSSVTAKQPVGYSAAYAACKQRIAALRAGGGEGGVELNNNVPVLAVEGYLHEAVCDRWYEQSLLVLCQPSLGVELQQMSQGTPVPAAAVTAARAATPPDYPHQLTGYAATIGSIMGASLQVPHTEWHEAATGVSRREVLALAARALAGSYKKLLAVSAAET